MRRPALVRLLAVLAIVCLSPSRATASVGSSPTPLPDEGGVTVMSTVARAGTAFDLDGDGTRELVRLTGVVTAGGRLMVDAWRVDAPADGAAPRLTLLGQQALFRGASVEEILTGAPRPTLDGMLPVSVNEPARFLLWHVGGKARLLVATIGTLGLDVPCCLTLWQVGLADGTLRLTRVLNTQDTASSAWSIDMDGDGTDEIVLTEPREGRGEVPLRVLRWNGTGFDQQRSSFIAPYNGWAAFAGGDSDGEPGDELFVSSDRIDGGPGALVQRVSLRGGDVRVESWPVRERGAIATLRDGARRLIALVGDEKILLVWPSDGSPLETASRVGAARLIGVLDDGAQAPLLTEEASEGGSVRLSAFSPRLEQIGTPEPRGRETSAGGFSRPVLENEFSPYVGAFPGGMPTGSPAWVFAGWLIGRQLPGTSALLDATPMALLPGVVPLGVLGPGGRFTALLSLPGFTPEFRGGVLVGETPALAGQVAVAPTATVLRPETAHASLGVGLQGAVPDREATGGDAVVSGARAFSVGIAAPAGSVVSSAVGAELSLESATQLTVGESGTVSVPIAAPDEKTTAFLVRLAVVTPAGHGYATQLAVRLLLAPPRLAVTTRTQFPSARAVLSGTTDQFVTVSVDGRQAPVERDGSFQTTVSAWIVPHDVTIVAEDAVGHRATEVISVVGIFDYRQLPWVPIVVVITLIVGATLYLRVPRVRPRGPRAPEDDGTLEEIEGA